MLSKIIKGFIVIMIFMFLVSCGAWCWHTFVPEDDGLPDMPKAGEATHSFLIKNTGGLVLSSDFEIFGEEVGKRTIALNGFWEVRGNDFKFIDANIILDENNFGEIIIKRR